MIADREKVYVCFIDLKKAFDSVNRAKLAQILADSTIDRNLVRTIKNFLQDTVINYQEHRIHTNIGVP